MKRPVLIGYVKRARLVAGLLPRCLGRSREESRQLSLVDHHAKADLGNRYHRGRSIDDRAHRSMFVTDDHRVSDNRAQPMEEVEHLRTAYSGKQVLIASRKANYLMRKDRTGYDYLIVIKYASIDVDQHISREEPIGQGFYLGRRNRSDSSKTRRIIPFVIEELHAPIGCAALPGRNFQSFANRVFAHRWMSSQGDHNVECRCDSGNLIKEGSEDDT